ncbi:hypothetical protein [Mesorhizobium sp.]|uniref:Rz1-like lysis system protein LysC n=1 Tax=Mesorhizobium sp. TaxID=1871066 RepID=UPI00121F3334|nr:hypothetical protein [Mesorhizobium sp.]TIR00818.1 MAG: hypothetical protein E5X36_03540 [Mesorhizobium sp.]
MLISSSLCLLLCAGCTTTQPPKVVVKYVTVERHIPASLIRPPPPGWSKPGGPEITADFIERGDVNETALRVCTAQIRKIAEWDRQ